MQDGNSFIIIHQLAYNTVTVVLTCWCLHADLNKKKNEFESDIWDKWQIDFCVLPYVPVESQPTISAEVTGE